LKHSDCEIDLKLLDYSTRQRTELADEPTCFAGRQKSARMVNQISDFRRTGGSAGTEQN
jgi:hypothetical protein